MEVLGSSKVRVDLILEKLRSVLVPYRTLACNSECLNGFDDWGEILSMIETGVVQLTDEHYRNIPDGSLVKCKGLLHINTVKYMTDCGYEYDYQFEQEDDFIAKVYSPRAG